MKLLNHENNYYLDEFHGKEVTGIAPGFYNIQLRPFRPPMLCKIDSKINEDYVFGKGDILETLLEEISTFAAKHDAYRAMGIIHKRGYILHGPPGTGKSAVAKRLCQTWVDSGGFVIDMARSFEGDEYRFNQVTDFIKQLLGVTALKVLFYCDEIDVLFDKLGDCDLAGLFDGSWINRESTCMFVGTTNYFERIDSKFIERPGRFDRRIVLTAMHPITQQLILRKLGLSEKIIAEISKKAEGVTAAMLTEIACRITLGMTSSGSNFNGDERF